MKNTYRVLVFDMGHVSAVEIIEADDDDAAVRRAQAIFPQEERELWESNRFVSRLKGNEDTP